MGSQTITGWPIKCHTFSDCFNDGDEFKMFVRVFCKIKDDKFLSEFREDTNEQLGDKCNIILHLNRLEDKEEKFNEEIKIKKISHWDRNEMTNSISQRLKTHQNLHQQSGSVRRQNIKVWRQGRWLEH